MSEYNFNHSFLPQDSYSFLDNVEYGFKSTHENTFQDIISSNLAKYNLHILEDAGVYFPESLGAKQAIAARLTYVLNKKSEKLMLAEDEGSVFFEHTAKLQNRVQSIPIFQNRTLFNPSLQRMQELGYKCDIEILEKPVTQENMWVQCSNIERGATPLAFDFLNSELLTESVEDIKSKALVTYFAGLSNFQKVSSLYIEHPVSGMLKVSLMTELLLTLQMWQQTNMSRKCIGSPAFSKVFIFSTARATNPFGKPSLPCMVELFENVGLQVLLLGLMKRDIPTGLMAIAIEWDQFERVYYQTMLEFHNQVEKLLSRNPQYIF